MTKTKVSIDVIIHATEDVDKFYGAFDNMFGIKPDEILSQNLTGHYDNPITILSARLSKKDAHLFIKKITQIPGKFEEIAKDLKDLISSSGLHLRFDKQKFVQRVLAISDGGAIRVKIYTPVYNKRETVKTYSVLLGLQTD